MQPFFRGDVTHQLRCQIKMRIAPRPARGSDHQRNAGANRSAQHQAQITLDRHGGTKRHAGTKVMRAGINAAAINADDMRVARQAGLKTRFREAVAQNGAGGEKAYFLHVVSCPLSAGLAPRLGQRLP